jgi:hypothetical protein
MREGEETMKKKLCYLILSLLLFSIPLIGTARSQTDGLTATLWTTNLAGNGEVNIFQLGEIVYLKTADTYPSNPIAPGKYKIYVFVGNIFKSTPLPSDPRIYFADQTMPPGFSPVEVVTDSNGRFGPVVSGKATPVPIWQAQVYGEFTVVLDQLEHFFQGSVITSAGIGYWNPQEGEDFREDISSAAPPPPSFFVVPEAGPVLLTATMAGAFACFAVVKRKKSKSA